MANSSQVYPGTESVGNCCFMITSRNYSIYNCGEYFYKLESSKIISSLATAIAILHYKSAVSLLIHISHINESLNHVPAGFMYFFFFKDFFDNLMSQVLP